MILPTPTWYILFVPFENYINATTSHGHLLKIFTSTRILNMVLKLNIPSVYLKPIPLQ